MANGFESNTTETAECEYIKKVAVLNTFDAEVFSHAFFQMMNNVTPPANLNDINPS